MLFRDIYESEEEFLEDANRFVYFKVLKGQNYSLLYALLFAQYANSPIANLDVNQFKLKLFTTVFKYGAEWERKLEIQKRLRELQETDLIKGTKVINNHAFNPSTEPSTSSLEELETINDQATNTVVKGLLDGYDTLLNLLDSSITDEFINRFKSLFKQFVMPEDPLLYITEGEE